MIDQVVDVAWLICWGGVVLPIVLLTPLIIAVKISIIDMGRVLLRSRLVRRSCVVGPLIGTVGGLAAIPMNHEFGYDLLLLISITVPEAAVMFELWMLIDRENRKKRERT